MNFFKRTVFDGEQNGMSFFNAKCSIIWAVWSMTMPLLVHSTVISNVNLIFETFNPISMVQFYEFNDKEFNISDGCIQDMFLYLDGLHRDIFWAVKCESIINFGFLLWSLEFKVVFGVLLLGKLMFFFYWTYGGSIV